VINLSPDKERVFRETFRVLKPGGRLMVSDIVLLKPLPEAVKASLEAYIGCIAGASMKDDYLNAIGKAEFQDIRIIDESLLHLKDFINHPTFPMPDLESVKAVSVVSIKVSAKKPD